MAKNRIIIFLYLAQMSYILGTEALSVLMILHLTAEFFALTIVYTFYQIKKDGNYLVHLPNIPGAFMFVILFVVIAYYLGLGLGELPEPGRNEDFSLRVFEGMYFPVALTFGGVIAATAFEVKQMKELNRINFLEREFRIQGLTATGVILVGLFSGIFHFIDPRIPIVAMGATRLILEGISAKRHVTLKNALSKSRSKLKSGSDSIG
jgi:hypothetical protein